MGINDGAKVAKHWIFNSRKAVHTKITGSLLTQYVQSVQGNLTRRVNVEGKRNEHFKKSINVSILVSKFQLKSCLQCQVTFAPLGTSTIKMTYQVNP